MFMCEKIIWAWPSVSLFRAPAAANLARIARAFVAETWPDSAEPRHALVKQRAKPMRPVG
jgi:hypothetical protein